MRVAHSVAEVADEVRNRLSGNGHLVAVDGFTGCGKTTLAMALAEALNGVRVGLDDFVDKNAATSDYRLRIRRVDVERGLSEKLDDSPVVIVDGVCILDVLTDLGRAPDTLVYVKRVSSQGLWHDGIDLDEFRASTASPDGRQWLSHYVMRYHTDKRPHQIAHVIYDRTESEPPEA